MKRIAIRGSALAIVLVAAMFLTTRAWLADNFLTDVAQGNMAEIALSQVALQRAQSAEVKQFAQHMIDDHTAAAQQLQSVAASKSVTLPAAMDSKHQSELDKLNKTTGDFDREYMKTMVNDHQKMVSLLQKEANGNGDAAYKTLASQLLPTVQQHLQMAQSISGQLGKGGSSSNSSMGNSSMNMNSNRASNSKSNGNKKANSNGNSNGNSNRP